MSKTPALRTPSSAKVGASDLQLDRQLCFSVYTTMLAVNKMFRKLQGGLDLTYPQYLVMLVLWERDGLKVSDICDKLFLETATLTPLLKRLEARGLVDRQRSLEDERKVIVTLTAEGRALLEDAKDIPAAMKVAMGCDTQKVNGLQRQLLDMRDSLIDAAR